MMLFCERRYNPGGPFVYFAQGCRGWVFAGVNQVFCVHGEGRAVLSGGWDEAQLHAQDRLLAAKTEMAVRYSGVDGEEVGVDCVCMQGRFVGAGLDVIF